MDKKALQIISGLREKIASSSFHELDVLAMLILLREHVEKTSLLKEFGDCIAHRIKDRGFLWDTTRKYQEALDKGTGGIFKFYTYQDILLSLNSAFKNHNLGEIDEETANRITVCIITLLQSIKVDLGDKNYTPFNFEVGLSKKQIALLGLAVLPVGGGKQAVPREGHIIQFTLLVAKNNGYDMGYVPDNIGDKYIEPFNGIAKSFCSNGNFFIQ